MNFLGRLIQKEIHAHDTVLDLGCGLMQSTTDILNKKYGGTSNEGVLRCKSIVGVDQNEHLVRELSTYYPKLITVVCAQAQEFAQTTPDRNYDVILCLDLLQHLSESDATDLIKECMRIARKRVIIYTPASYESIIQGNSSTATLKHHCFIHPAYLERLGFAVSFPMPDRNTLAVLNKSR